MGLRTSNFSMITLVISVVMKYNNILLNTRMIRVKRVNKVPFHRKPILHILTYILFTILLLASCHPVAILRGDEEAFVDEVVDFDGSDSYDSDGYIANYRWQFGNGNIGTGVRTSHAFSQTGQYVVTLTVADNMGLTDEDSITVSVVEADGENGFVKGIVKNLSGKPLEGLEIRLGSYTTTTSITGRFEFVEVEPDSYVLTGSGGVNEHYIVNKKDVNVDYGILNDLGVLTAYRIQGCGVVIQSITRTSVKSLDGNRSESVQNMPIWRNNWKKIDLGNHLMIAPSHFQKLYSGVSAKSSSDTFINENIAFFFISWEDVSEVWIDHYAIQLIGTNGTSKNTVWYSNEVHPEDPEFDRSAPEAYLDLSSELAGKIDAPGEYLFRIVGMSTDETQEKLLPSLPISLATRIQQYPTYLSYSGNTLSWNQVPGADGYRVQLYADETRVFDTNEALGHLLAGTTLELPEDLTPGEYYTWYVDAHANDDTGWVVEITRGISGFMR